MIVYRRKIVSNTNIPVQLLIKFKAVTDLMGIVFDKLDPANQSAFLKFCESNLNESTKLFPNKLELDFDASEAAPE